MSGRSRGSLTYVISNLIRKPHPSPRDLKNAVDQILGMKVRKVGMTQLRRIHGTLSDILDKYSVYKERNQLDSWCELLIRSRIVIEYQKRRMSELRDLADSIITYINYLLNLYLQEAFDRLECHVRYFRVILDALVTSAMGG